MRQIWPTHLSWLIFDLEKECKATIIPDCRDGLVNAGLQSVVANVLAKFRMVPPGDWG